jgi:hypothetical protein
VLRARCSTKSVRLPSTIGTTTTSRGGRRGSVASPPMKIRRRSRRGGATLPARRWTGATCRGRPRRRLPAPQKCHHRGGCRRPRATRTWARARDQQLALPDRTSGQFALMWCPVGQAYPSHREPRPTKLTPRGSRRSDRLPSANFSTVRTAPTRTRYRGIGHGRGRWTRRRQSLLIRGGGAPDVHVSLVAGGG